MDIINFYLGWLKGTEETLRQNGLKKAEAANAYRAAYEKLHELIEKKIEEELNDIH